LKIPWKCPLFLFPFSKQLIKTTALLKLDFKKKANKKTKTSPCFGIKPKEGRERILKLLGISSFGRAL